MAALKLHSRHVGPTLARCHQVFARIGTQDQMAARFYDRERNARSVIAAILGNFNGIEEFFEKATSAGPRADATRQ